MARHDRAHDITIHSSVLGNRGYMLAREGQLGRGARRWQVQAVGASIAEQTPTEARYGNQPAIIEAPMVFRTAHRGYGDEQMRGEGRYHYAVNVDARFPNAIIAGPLVTTVEIGGSQNVSGFFEQDDMLFCIAGRYCKEIDGEDTVTLAKDFGADKIATDCAVFGGTAYVGMGYSEAFWQRASANDPTKTWTQASGLYIGYLATFKDRVWASVTANAVRSFATTPTTASNWSGSYPIGDPGAPITEVAELADYLYIGKQDGLFTLDEDYIARPATPELASVRSANNCVHMRAWHGSMWVPHIRGLLNYRALGANGFVVTPATPGAWVTSANPARGLVTALAGDNRWLYAALYTPDGDTYIMAGRESFADEQEHGLLIWHPLAKIAGKRCNAMHLSGLRTNPTLWFGVGADVGYITLPRNGENPLQDSNSRYATTGSIYFPAHSWSAPTTKKLWKAITVEGRDLTPSRYVNVYYRVDEVSNWTYAGRANRWPKSVIPLPAAGVSGARLEIRLDLVLPDSSKPPVIYSVVVRGAERPQTIEVITAAVRCADNLRLNSGAPERRSGADILTELRQYATLGEAVTLTDTLGVERRVLVLGPVDEIEVEQDGTNAPEKIAMVKMAVFETSEESSSLGEYAVYGTSKYGAGDIYV